MIDWEGIEQASLDALLGVGNRWGARAKEIARRKAPVRKIFEGQGATERIRLKSISEIEQGRSIRRRVGLGPEYGPLNTRGVSPATVLTRYAPQELSQRAIAGPGRLKSAEAQSRLDRRGRWELSSMRSANKGKLGGRLRNEIFVTSARVVNRRVRVLLVSPTPYAKHQELGNRHNPAHPYLRPGAYESAEATKTDLRATMPPVVRGRLRATIPVVIRI